MSYKMSELRDYLSCFGNIDQDQSRKNIVQTINKMTDEKSFDLVFEITRFINHNFQIVEYQIPDNSSLTVLFFSTTNSLIIGEDKVNSKKYNSSFIQSKKFDPNILLSITDDQKDIILNYFQAFCSRLKVSIKSHNNSSKKLKETIISDSNIKANIQTLKRYLYSSNKKFLFDELNNRSAENYFNSDEKKRYDELCSEAIQIVDYDCNGEKVELENILDQEIGLYKIASKKILTIQKNCEDELDKVKSPYVLTKKIAEKIYVLCRSILVLENSEECCHILFSNGKILYQYDSLLDYCKKYLNILYDSLFAPISEKDMKKETTIFIENLKNWNSSNLLS